VRQEADRGASEVKSDHIAWREKPPLVRLASDRVQVKPRVVRLPRAALESHLRFC
jgi:hypothetical protein